MPLLALPNELLLQIARCLLQSLTCQCDHHRHCDCDCHCHHISADLSAFSRVNQRLHALLAEYLLATASTLHVLFWAVANSRTDTVALALERGADPNSPLRPNAHIATSWLIETTPVELAISMRMHSVDAKTHALKLATLELLLAAGGTCTDDSLHKPTRYGDLDLLTLCLPHFKKEIDDSSSYCGLRTLLDVAASRGHVEIMKLLIAAGARVNSASNRGSRQFYPALWACCNAPIRVLQVLLDGGAEAAWRAPHGVSVVQNLRQRSVETPELEDKVELLVRYGAMDEDASWLTAREGGRRRGVPPELEYRGWAPGSRQAPVDWAQEWVMVGSEEGCGCRRAELQVTGTGE